jgi:RNA polymerase sigma-70 factor (ECF subfamily)
LLVATVEFSFGIFTKADAPPGVPLQLEIGTAQITFVNMDAPVDIARQLIDERETFVAFVRNRVGDPELADDIVQDSFVKAMKHAGELRENESAVAWFYRILRRTIIDAYRRREARTRALDAFEAEQEMTAEEERTLCGCLRLLIPTLKPEYAEVIERVELRGEPMESVAKDLQLSASNLRVRLHRGRKQLQERLEQTCRVCAKHGCLDCDCA